MPELFADRPVRTMNLLVGSSGSGLPFHHHQKTWQMLSFGRKAWFLVPPGAMSDGLAATVGPRLFPADGFSGATLGRRPGDRPLRCVQRVRRRPSSSSPFFPRPWEVIGTRARSRGCPRAGGTRR